MVESVTKPGWPRAAAVTAAVVGIVLGALFGTMAFVRWLTGGDIGLFVVVACGCLCAFAAGIAFATAAGFTDSFRVHPRRRHIPVIVGTVTGMYALTWLGMTIAATIDIPVSLMVPHTSGSPPSAVIAGVLVAILLIGPVEELLFRGILMDAISRASDWRTGVGVSTIVFAVLHAVPLGSIDLTVVVYVACVAVGGGILGIVYHRTRHLGVVALIHGLYDAVIIVAAAGYLPL
ncbi:CPBP family intramembrane glutamic endopeptidase [Halosimplex carlsbadense]|uniref:CPBP family intramembrane glutamic endopeptidase n=1 Tax=Halosimplex carlsbadense TaxID=171164 RepID=UPI000677CC48|nr:CPBP family intramembrane glutamic endopeptidase [Halosimplex carlsbadense]